MSKPIARTLLFDIRTEAATLASGMFDYKPPLSELWEMANFYEQFLLLGGEGTREAFGPKQATETAVIIDKLRDKWVTHSNEAE